VYFFAGLLATVTFALADLQSGGQAAQQPGGHDGSSQQHEPVSAASSVPQHLQACAVLITRGVGNAHALATIRIASVPTINSHVRLIWVSPRKENDGKRTGYYTRWVFRGKIDCEINGPLGLATRDRTPFNVLNGQDGAARGPMQLRPILVAGQLQHL
jgi:hypothetical protein